MGAMLMVIPTGSKYDGRPATYSALYGHEACGTRIAFERRLWGKGRGGIEYIAYSRQVLALPKTRLGIMWQGGVPANESATEHRVGSLGWVPKDMAHPMRIGLYNGMQAAVTHYELRKNNKYSSHYPYTIVTATVVQGHRSSVWSVIHGYRKTYRFTPWTSNEVVQCWMPSPISKQEAASEE